MGSINDDVTHESKKSRKRIEDKSKKFANPDVEFAFGWNRFNLRLIGLWPDQTCNDGRSSPIVRYCSPMWNLWVVSFIVIPQALAPTVNSYVLDDLIQIVSGVVGVVGACVKILVLWNNGEVLAWCLDFFADDWTRTLTTEERELMMKYSRLGRNISIGFTLLMHCLVWSYIVMKVPLLMYMDLKTWNASDIGNALLYPAYFPIDLSKSSNFAFAWTGQLLATFSSTIGYTASDCFIAMLVIHLCGQISILRRALVEILDNEKSLDLETFRENLAVIVRRHEKLIRFAGVIEDAVNTMLLVLTIIYMVQFGLQLFGLTTAVTERKPGKFPFVQIIFFVSYLNVTIVHLFLYCYVGDMLREESQSLGLASYSCKWYNLSGRDATDLMLVIQRSRAPLEISAGKFVAFSLELFGNVLKTSLSYFSVLLTMKERASE